MAALRDLGDDGRALTARYRRGYGDAAIAALESGGDYEAVRDRAVRLAVAALGGLAPKAQPG
ncbi:hypothetical protein [Streptomyces albus]|uniref:hypothetical protein n=1 Tax=Streptomyces albus TaxID=1888 RepID=UPI000A8C6C66|nr:hypothetical protein [Streptomyces albus]